MDNLKNMQEFPGGSVVRTRHFGSGSIPGGRTKILQAAGCGQKKKIQR